MTVPHEVLLLEWALTYPFARPPGDFVFLDGAARPIVDRTSRDLGGWMIQAGAGSDKLKDVVRPDRLAGLADQAMAPVLAIGSNASPVQMRRKFAAILSDVLVVVLNVTVRDICVRYANAIAAYGSIPVTIHHEQDARAKIALTVLREHERAIIDASENLGDEYDLAQVTLEDPSLATLIGSPTAPAYQSCTGAIPLGPPGVNVAGGDVVEATQWEAQEHIIRRLGLTMPVETFVLENIADPSLRAERNAQLAAMAAA